MTVPHSKFWDYFNNKEFVRAQREFDELSSNEKQNIFKDLFQQSAGHRMPFMVSVLRRELKDNTSFDEFYQSWLPREDMCTKVTIGEQVFHQHFPIPVRVVNAININNSKEIISIGISWVTNKDQEQTLLKQIKQSSEGKDKNNELRHERIKDVAQGELIGLFRVETDDYLGTPF
ncbi:hypothetical protein [Legionella bononiensis]|uniref:Uncharacterized protein n=1 Tax=Legionella bononiensis TaxID=2793102 RepID=A0ABS1WG36_9GAMM|nr:hypothetical protein [Legionella bononiensis]MBL7481762.1 hypothetical protein [Legionella bononiensis]MBL7528311.1 hypothetical protein [Legionella bononiensis]MBL7562785.1 hypothetical protein [Legionella bononiensis]